MTSKTESAASRSHSRGNWGREGLFDISSIYSLFKHYTEDTLFVQHFPRNPVVIWDRWPFVWTHWSILSFRWLSVAAGPLWAVVDVFSLFHLNLQFDWGKHNWGIIWINHISHLFFISYTVFVTAITKSISDVLLCVRSPFTTRGQCFPFRRSGEQRVEGDGAWNQIKRERGQKTERNKQKSKTS